MTHPLSAALLAALAAPAFAAPAQKAELPRFPTPKNLNFAQVQGKSQSFELNGQTVRYRAFENIVYVLKPADTRYQTLNVYIPEAYFSGGSIDGYTAQTAPIFFPNNIGGYMPATAGQPENDQRAGGKPNAIMVALSKGYVVASAGARGRTEANGHAPAAIVDLKAAVRYLKANDKVMAGDANKIISNGTSAGGALSALLGTSGGSKDYEPYLRQLGAARANDTIFAVSAYCPITNLEHADAAYEWQFNGVNDYQKNRHLHVGLQGGTQAGKRHANARTNPAFRQPESPVSRLCKQPQTQKRARHADDAGQKRQRHVQNPNGNHAAAIGAKSIRQRQRFIRPNMAHHPKRQSHRRRLCRLRPLCGAAKNRACV